MNIDVDTIHEALPDGLLSRWDQLLADTLQEGGPLTICLVGAFSSGKSSLLNMLLDRPVLPTGQTETTAIPTFIESGDGWAFGHGRGESWEEIDAKTFEDLSSRPAQPGEFATVEAPADWLQDFNVVDLPGLSSLDSGRSEMTRAQISSADVVLYVLQKRGPTRSDIEALSEAARRGKHVILTVSHWDEVRRAAEDIDQKPVDLEKWQGQIEEGTGLEIDLLPVSHDGIGREELEARLTGLSGSTSEIRRNRFVSRAQKIISQAIDELDARLEVLEAESSQEISELRDELNRQQRELTEFKSELYEERHEHREHLQTAYEDAKDSTLGSLRERVSEDLDNLKKDPSEESWEIFIESLNEAGRTSLTELTDEVDALLDQALDTSDLQADWSEVEFEFPSVPDMQADDWFDAADAERLQSQIQDLDQELDDLDEDEPAADEAERERQHALSGKLHELKRARQQIAGQELPKTRVESTTGRKIGSAIGNAADLALMFVNPEIIASKAASLVGKGASVAKGVVNTSKLSKGVKFLQKSKRARRLAKGLQKAGEKLDDFDSEEFRDNATDYAEAIQQQHLDEELNETGKKLDALGVLEMFSVSYWTEKVGGWFDSMAGVEFEIDEEALAERRAAVGQMDEKIQSIQQNLSQLKQLRRQSDLSDYERKIKKREKAELERELAEQRELARQQRQKLEEERNDLLRERASQEATRALQRARKRLIDESRGLRKQLESSFEQYWEQALEDALEEKEAHLNELQETLEKAPEERERQKEEVVARIEVLRTQQNRLQEELN